MPGETMRALRMRMLTAAPAEWGIRPKAGSPKVYGVLMEMPVEGQTASVASLATGDASLYTTSGFGVIGGIGHEAVRTAAVDFVKAAERHVEAATPAREFPYPNPGRIRFYLLGFDGVRVLESDETALCDGSDPRSPLWEAGQHVLAQLRTLTEKSGTD